MMNFTRPNRIALICIALAIFVLILSDVYSNDNDEVDRIIPSPVLSVVLTQAEEEKLAVRVPAMGNVMAWQEAIISAESDGLKLIAINVNVGDIVKRGQVLAHFNADIIAAELAEAVASVAQAEAATIEAELNYRRAKNLEHANAISAQQLDQNKVAAITARARLDAARAVEKQNRLRLAQTQVLAPSDGVITARTATIGTVVPAAQELFRLIEDNRLEWRAVVATSDIEKLIPGQSVVITARNYPTIKGTLRIVAPTIDTATHNGLAYVDLPANTSLRAGTFTRGYIEVGDSVALTLPQRAVILRDGFHYVMKVDTKSLVTLKKISVGKAIDDRIEITGGLVVSEQVIAAGLGFLSEGDSVKVVNPVQAASFSEENQIYPIATEKPQPPITEGKIETGLDIEKFEVKQ